MFPALERKHLRILKRSLPRSGDYLAVAVGLFIVRLALEQRMFIAFIPLIGMWLFRLDRRLLGWWGVLSILLSAHFFYLEFKPITVPQSGQIIAVDENKHTFSTDHGVFHLYLGQEALAPGVYITGDFSVLPEADADLIGAFDSQAYLVGESIQGTVYAKRVEVIDFAPVPRSIPARIEAYIDREFSVLNGYMTAFFLGSTDGFEDDFLARIRSLGIAHIFAVSGLHVGLLAVALEGLFKRLHPDIRLVLIMGILSGYLVLTQFSISLLRASALYLFIKLNRRFRGNYTPLDGLALLIIFSLLFTPYVTRQPAFLLSYSVTLILLLMAPTLSQKSAPLLVSIYAFMTTLPLIMSMSGSVNLSSIGLNIVAVLALGFYLLPLSYLTFFVPALEPALWPLFLGFEGLVNGAFEWLYWPVSIPFTFKGYGVIYYSLLVGVLIVSKGRWKTLLTLASALLAVFYLFGYATFFPVLTMLDVDGDAFLYQAPFNRCNILIDGGTDFTSDALITHLKNLGIHHFDVVVTTHDDADHSQGIQALFNDAYFTWDLHVTPENLPDQISCEKATLDFDRPVNTYTSKNDGSVVLTLERGSWRGLFTGDIEALREAEFIESPIDAVDVLKVSHHGSSSSTSEAFIDHVNPKLALINLPHSNRFDFPSDEVITRLNERNISIFRTDWHGTTRVIIGKNWLIPMPNRGP